MLYVIHAFEGIFQGLHGIEIWDICDCSSEEEAYEFMQEDSFILIEEYQDVKDELEEEIERNITEDMDQADIDELTEKIYAENVSGEVFKINKEKTKDLTFRDLFIKLKNDPDDFITKYCCFE